MQIIVYKNGDTIYKIELFETYINKGLTQEEIVERVNNFKGAEVISIPSDLEEIFHFLLGGKKYKLLNDLNDMMEDLNYHIRSINDHMRSIREYGDTLDEIHSSMESTSASISDMKNTLENSLETFNNLKQ